MITGGQRSGKSSFAQKLALENDPKPVYLATSRNWDEDHQQRIRRHQADRDANWTTIEEEKYLSRLNLSGKTVVLDCITLWLTNFFHDLHGDAERALNEAKGEFEIFIRQEMYLIVVTNELGMSLHAETEAGRKFTDLQGWMNQNLAKKADRVVLMVCGYPVEVKA